jgi:hypothetical protein
MIPEMRFQILALAASLAVSALAGFALAVPPAETPARSDRFAAVSDASLGSATIFTEFGNEMAWEDRETIDRCAPPPADTARRGNGLLDRLVHRVSEDSRDRQPEAAARPAAACPTR